MQRGSSIDQAVVSQTRALLRADDVSGAQALGESLRARPGTEPIGRLLCGITAFHRGFVDLAWEHLGDLPRRMWAEHAPREYARSGLRSAPDHTLAEIAELAREKPAQVHARTWFALIGPLLAIGRADLARPILAILDETVAGGARDNSSLRTRIEGLRPWVEADLDASVAPPRDGTTFAVLDYLRPGAKEGSRNIGDHIQSIAALGHLARHQGVRLSGDPELVELLAHLQARTRPELRLHEVDAEVAVVTVQRDASMFQQVPDGTWTLCFGWYMHPISGYRYGFPLNSALRPIFVSFHCNERALLTEPAVEYLKRYGPVGCRDWTTVYLLLSMGVPAFFSGCLTTTISTVFPERTAGARSDLGTAYVDVHASEAPQGAVVYRHALPEVRERSFAANCFVALDRLETYRRHERVVTSRLHCYLPLRSLGEPADFRPRNQSDPRFNGLIGIGDDEFDAMRAALLGRLEPVVASIVSGASEDEVYSQWRELTAADVEVARSKARSPAQPPPPPTGLAEAVAKVVAGALAETSTGEHLSTDVVHCAVDLRRGQGARVTTMIRSLARHTSRPLHVWLLADGPRPNLRQELAGILPAGSVSWLMTGGTTNPTDATLSHRPRLVLAELLPDVDRVVMLPAEAVITADVGALADRDLEGCLFAAPTVVAPDRSSGFEVLHRAAERLNEHPSVSAELLRTAYAAHSFDFDAFSTEVMIFDLMRMREEGFAAWAVGTSLEYSLTEREVLHYLVGSHRAVVPAAWSWVPGHAPDPGAGLTHWTGEAKPWEGLIVPGQELWERYAED